MGTATGITLGHAATHRHQILPSMFFHDRIRRHPAGIVLIVDMKSRSRDGVVGKAGKRIPILLGIGHVNGRRMNAAGDLVSEILRQPSRTDRSEAVTQNVNL